MNEAIEIPTFAGDAKSILEKIKPAAAAPLTFETQGLGKPSEVTLVPYFRIAHQRYNLYWKMTPA
jgi:hypothetical protein